MNSTQRTIFEWLKQRCAEEQNPLGSLFADGTPEDEAIRMIFLNYRGGDAARGLRLSNLGLQLMKCYTRAYEVKLPEGYRVKPQHLLWLDRRANLPYHYSKEYIVLFELDLGTRLKLADGDIDVLIEGERKGGTLSR